MKCHIHNQPFTMTCARCADTMCPKCAEYIDGSWYCPECAVKERRFAAGLNDYRDFILLGRGEYVGGEEASDIDASGI